MNSNKCIQKQTINDNAGNLRDIRRNPPANMSPKEYAVFLGISERTAREHISKGLVPYVRMGGRIIIRLKDLEAKLDDLVVS